MLCDHCKHDEKCISKYDGTLHIVESFPDKNGFKILAWGCKEYEPASEVSE